MPEIELNSSLCNGLAGEALLEEDFVRAFNRAIAGINGLARQGLIK